MRTLTASDAAKAVVRRNTEEVQGKGDFDVFEELFWDDFVDHTSQPGTTPDLVLSGELEAMVGDETFTLRAGETLIAPRNIPHQFRNSGNVANHYLIMFSPAGFEEFLKATSVPAPGGAVAPAEPPPVAVHNVFELAADYGIQLGSDASLVKSKYNE
jgi:hypothetical protein